MLRAGWSVLWLLMGCPMDTGVNNLGQGRGRPGPEKIVPKNEHEEEPPEYQEKDCLGDELVVFSPGEIFVLAWEQSQASATLTTDSEGWYAIYDASLAESGGSQTNESAYIQIITPGNPTGQPRFANCEGWWIAVDEDNDGTPPEEPVYLGTFWLEAGDNTLTLHHFCTLYRAGLCEDFHNPTPENGSCDSPNWNSAHLLGEGLCLTDQSEL